MEKKIQAYPPQADICAFVSTSLETKRPARRPSQGSGRPKCKRERVAEDRFGSRLCENVHEPRMPRIVFSIAFFREKLPVQLVSASMNRDGNSTPKLGVGVFTQPGSKAPF